MEQIVQEVAGEARFQLISKSRDAYYRIWRESDTTVLKVYGSQSLWRRENRALASLQGVAGLPTILREGTNDSTAWVEFADADRWTLASMPQNRDMAHKAGQILRASTRPIPAISRTSAGVWTRCGSSRTTPPRSSA